jgi:tetratricopeptide (TPR) repeat protein
MRLLIFFLATSLGASEPAQDPARIARDAADGPALRVQISQSRDLLRIAQLNLFLCEAAYAADDNAAVKRAAQAAIDAAEKAVRQQPASSEAHRLLGESLSQMIPHVFAGGIRLGPRSTREMDRALELDPRNADAHISRATSYLFTPDAFGGDKQKALEHLRKAVELDPASDTAHLWMAQVYVELKQKDRAAAELETARRINPARAWTRYLASQIGVRP